MAQIELFSDDEKEQAVKLKRLLLIIWLVAAVFSIGLILTLGGIDIYRINKFYDRTHHTLFMAIAALISVLFSVGSFFFFSVPFRYVCAAVKLLNSIEVGDKENIEVTFICKGSEITVKDGIEFNSFTVQTKPLRREDITTRQVLVEASKEFPDFSEGQKITLTLYSGILLSYLT